MSSRSLIPFLLVAAVVFACGPRAHSEASAKKDSAVVAQAGAPVRPTLSAAHASGDRKNTVEAQLYVRTNEQSVTFALHVFNTGKRRVEITFPSGQTYDFVVLDSTGREVWRWGKGRMFTQTLRNKLLGGGESLELEETFEEPLEPGRYTARATLTSQNYPLVQQTEFTIDKTTIASR
jgi:Intracellular proteinase inhibitor